MFKIEDFDIKLDTEVVGRNFVYCEEIESTNSFLLETTEYTKNGTVILAESQSKGRGRKERTWSSQKGMNLTFSVLLNQHLKELPINILVFGSALAVAQSVENLHQFKIDLKWPNDLLVNGKKLAGILMETSSRGSELSKVVIGFGLNVNQTQFNGDYLIPPTSVKTEFGSTVNRERLLSDILNNLERVLQECYNNPAKVLEDWKGKCKMLGEKIKVVESDSVKHGIFENIDENGFLLLRTATGTETIHFGDVSIR